MRTPIISNIAPLAANYDALLCDAWGVIHNGVTLSDGIVEALTRFREERGPVIILTNAPRPSSVIPAQLDRLGLPRAAWDSVVTSGDTILSAVAAQNGKSVFRLGPEYDRDLYEGLDVNFASFEEASYIICTGLFHEREETPDDYEEMLQAAYARAMPMICANPDLVVNMGGQLIYCAGALAERYRQLGGEVIYGGKPHRPIYELAMQRLNSLAAKPIAKNKILAIGDGVRTDLIGANNFGIDAVFIAGANGIHFTGAEAVAIEKALLQEEAHAVAAMELLRW